MAEDKEVKKYFENMPYGDDALSSEIHGKHNQVVINKFISSLVRLYDKSTIDGDKEMAGHYYDMVKKISKNLDNLKEIKKEFAINYGGGVGGKNLYSNYTNLNWDREFFLERGMINFDKNMKPVLIVNGPNGEEAKHIEDVTQDWVIKGSEENDFMRLQQEAVKQRNTQNKELDFDIDWEVDKIVNNSWKILATDKIGGRYFLHDWMIENQDDIISGKIPEEMLHPDSFNPDFDSRLHEYYANRLKKSFDPNYQTLAEAKKADELIDKVNKQENKA